MPIWRRRASIAGLAAVGAVCRAGAPCDAQNVSQGMSLGAHNYVTLLTKSLGIGSDLVVNGSGVPDLWIQHEMNVTIANPSPGYYLWGASTAGQFICGGDSGSPAFRNSGYMDEIGPYWQARAGVMHGGSNDIQINGTPCGNDGRITRVRDSNTVFKINWINGIVNFWTGQHCTPLTKPPCGAGTAELTSVIPRRSFLGRGVCRSGRDVARGDDDY